MISFILIYFDVKNNFTIIQCHEKKKNLVKLELKICLSRNLEFLFMEIDFKWKIFQQLFQSVT